MQLRAETERKLRPKPWLPGLALAASVVVAVNLAWHLREQSVSPAAQEIVDATAATEPVAKAPPEPKPEAPADGWAVASPREAGSGAGETAAPKSRDNAVVQRKAAADERERSARVNQTMEPHQAVSPAQAEDVAHPKAEREGKHGWGLSAGGTDYGIGLARRRPHTGNNSLTIQSKTEQPRSPYGALRHRIPAAPFRGHPVLFEAWLRTEAVAGLAELWLRLDDANNRRLQLTDMHDRPIRGDQGWQAHYLILEVPAEAEWINFGVALHGTGRVWIDAARIESLSPDPEANAASARFYDFEERQLEH